MQSKTIWITGASSGIGKELALQYAALKYSLILSSRRETELDEVASLCETLGAKCLVLPFDLASIIDVEQLLDKALTLTGKIDVLINNGGISQRGLAADTKVEVLRRIMEVNFFGQVQLSQAVLRHFIKAGGGHFAVVSSLTGKFGWGLRSAYAASKHALQGYFESLAIENFKYNVKVTMICPVSITTNMSINALNADGTTKGSMDEAHLKGLSAEACAAQIIEAIKHEKREVLIGKKEKFMVQIKRFLPSVFFSKAVKMDPWN